MPHHLYMLHLRNGTIYVGSTNNLERRVADHKDGRGSFSCAKSTPTELIYSEEFADLTSAIRRERQLKGWSRVKKLALAEGRLEALHQLV